MQTYRIHAIIDVTDFSEEGALKEFYDLIRDNTHLGFSNGAVLNIEELEENEQYE